MVAARLEPGVVAGMAGRGPEAGHRSSADGGRTSGRARFADNLKTILIAAIIAGHAVIGYAASTDAWSYSDVREATLSPVVEAAVVPLLFGAAFVIPLLFLLAGLLTRPSLERKGVGAYVRDRLLRLGVPFVVFALVLWPLLEYALFRWLGGAPGLGEYLRAEGSLDTGVLWFVGVLLIFSLAYAGLIGAAGVIGARGLRCSAEPRAEAREIRTGHLLVLVVAVAVTTFLVRLVVPAESDNRFVDLNMWEWPACAAAFGLGIAAAPAGWLAAVPDRVRRQARTATLVTAAGAVGFVGVSLAGGVSLESMTGGWRWPALAFAAGESALGIFGAVWLLGAAQRHLDRPLRWVSPAAARGAYGAFLLQGPVLVGLALALRPVPVPAEVKAVVVAVAGVAASFAIASFLIRRSRFLARIL